MGRKLSYIEKLQNAHKRRANAVKRYYESLKAEKRQEKGVVSKKKALKRKRVKLVPVKRLIKKLDKIFSEYIRARDGGKCVICGSRVRVQNGHLIRRGKHNVRFDEANCNAQCSSCNYRHEFEPQHYVQWFLKNYGSKMFEDLVDRSRILKQWKRWELEELITKYEEKSKTPNGTSILGKE